LTSRVIVLTFVDEQISEIPSQLRRAIKALSEDARLAVLVVLLKNGEMTFSELSRALDMSSSNLTHHLKKLIQAALVENYFQRREDTEEYSFYKPTLLAEDFARNMFGVLDYTNLLEGALIRVQKPIVYPDLFPIKLEESIEGLPKLSAMPKYTFPLGQAHKDQTQTQYQVTIKRTVTEFKFSFPSIFKLHKEELEE
jgi:DNA-binding transcriptional ArsR family regulator